MYTYRHRACHYLITERILLTIPYLLRTDYKMRLVEADPDLEAEKAE